MAKFAMLLTGTIAPNSNFVAVKDVALRREEYLTALNYYRGFAPVFFLENSDYDLFGDREFTDLQGVQLRKFAMRSEYSRGKGYNEFAMIDAWYNTENEPPARFLKITGRYQLRNLSQYLSECRNVKPDTLLIDRLVRPKIAVTSIFSASWKTYGQIMEGLYHQMDDAAGIWAEHVFFRSLAGKPNVHCFAHEPDVHGISGSTGQPLQRARWKWAIYDEVRRLNLKIDARYLYFRK